MERCQVEGRMRHGRDSLLARPDLSPLYPLIRTAAAMQVAGNLQHPESIIDNFDVQIMFACFHAIRASITCPTKKARCRFCAHGRCRNSRTETTDLMCFLISNISPPTARLDLSLYNSRRSTHLVSHSQLDIMKHATQAGLSSALVLGQRSMHGARMDVQRLARLELSVCFWRYSLKLTP